MALINKMSLSFATWSLVVLTGCAGSGDAAHAAHEAHEATSAATHEAAHDAAHAAHAATDAADVADVSPAHAAPHVRVLDAQRLAATRARVIAGDPALQASLGTLVKLADAAFDEPMLSVADKKDLPPSGNKNDYVSLSPYWWPNPDTPDGLPYIRKDGVFNPERDQYDVSKLDTFGKTVTRLSFAYYYTGEERYAAEAVKRLQHFLVDPQTRMTPRMQYGQFIPGVNNGRKYGVIETLRVRWVPDAVEMLAGSQALTPEAVGGVRGWFGDYAKWLNTSEFGVAERDGDNNHATWCKAQIANYSAFAGDLDTTREMVEMAREKLTQQFEPDGSQPEELARTRGLDYSDFNLRGYSDLATLGERVGVDLWNHVAADGTSLRGGYDFVLPFITEEKEFPYPQIAKRKHDRYAEMLRRAAIAYNDPAFEAAIDTLEIKDETRMQLDLIWPLPQVFPAAQ